MNDRAKLTIPDLALKKAANEKLVMVAVGEALTAAWAERAGVDIVGVGDSLGMTLHGHDNTLAMTVDQMIDHCKAVRRGAPNTLSLVSMPYGSYATEELAVLNAIRLIKEGGAEAVKLQGGRELFDTFKPKFAKRYGNMAEVATKAFEAYAEDVRNGTFPDAEHSYNMKPKEVEQFHHLLSESKQQED